jgi:hypothetical protein
VCVYCTIGTIIGRCARAPSWARALALPRRLQLASGDCGVKFVHDGEQLGAGLGLVFEEGEKDESREFVNGDEEVAEALSAEMTMSLRSTWRTPASGAGVERVPRCAAWVMRASAQLAQLMAEAEATLRGPSAVGLAMAWM